MRHSNPLLQIRRKNAWPTALPATFVWREIASPASFEKKKIIIFFDDVYDKTQSKFMNKSTNMESKERDRENRRRRSDVRRQRERLRALANRQNKSDEQREKEQERAPKKNPC